MLGMKYRKDQMVTLNHDIGDKFFHIKQGSVFKIDRVDYIFRCYDICLADDESIWFDDITEIEIVAI